MGASIERIFQIFSKISMYVKLKFFVHWIVSNHRLIFKIQSWPHIDRKFGCADIPEDNVCLPGLGNVPDGL